MLHMHIRRGAIAVAVAAALAADARAGQKNGDSWRDHIDPPDGFKLTRFAGAPEVNYPVTITAGPRGTVFVGCAPNLALDTDREDGRVMRCRDTNGDGRADERTTFAKVKYPRGLVYTGRKLYVLHPPKLTVHEDTDGDGRADRSRLLVKNLTTDTLQENGPNHTANGLRMGIDGWLYIGIGDYGFIDATGTDGRSVTNRSGAVLRVRPDGSGLEVWARDLRQIFDLAVSPALNLFARGNRHNAGRWRVRLHHLLPLAHHGYPTRYRFFEEEIHAPLGDYGAGSGTGALFVDEPALAAPLGHTLLTADWGRGEVYRHPLEPGGGSFEAGQRLLWTMTKPTELAVDGRGNLYACSLWGATFRYNGPDVGFVARMRPEGTHVPSVPVFSRMPSPRLAEELRSGSAKRRFHAQRELLRRAPGKNALESVRKLALDADASLEARTAALFTLKQLHGVDSHPTLVKAAEDPAVRAMALRALSGRRSQTEGVPVSLFVRSLRKGEARSRLEAAAGLARLGAKQEAEHLLPLAVLPRADDFSPSEQPTNPEGEPVNAELKATRRAVPHVAHRALVELRAAGACLAALDSSTQMGRFDAALRALQYMHTEKVVDGLIERWRALEEPTRRRHILTALIRLYHREAEWDGSWWGGQPEDLGPYYEPTRWAASSRIERILRRAARDAGPALERYLAHQLDRHRVRLKGLSKVMRHVNGDEQDGKQQDVQPSAVDLSKVLSRKVRKGDVGTMTLEQVIERTAEHEGDSSEGKTLFRRQGCIACHAGSRRQTARGPFLGDVAQRDDRPTLTRSILRPDARITQGFAMRWFTWKGGGASGFVAQQSADRLKLITVTGRTVTLRKDQIRQRGRLEQSPMPAGLVDDLTPKQLASLLAYLESLAAD